MYLLVVVMRPKFLSQRITSPLQDGNCFFEPDARKRHRWIRLPVASEATHRLMRSQALSLLTTVCCWGDYRRGASEDRQAATGLKWVLGTIPRKYVIASKGVGGAPEDWRTDKPDKRRRKKCLFYALVNIDEVPQGVVTGAMK
jgi:hypothetical protein